MKKVHERLEKVTRNVIDLDEMCDYIVPKTRSRKASKGLPVQWDVGTLIEKLSLMDPAATLSFEKDCDSDAAWTDHYLVATSRRMETDEEWKERVAIIVADESRRAKAIKARDEAIKKQEIETLNRLYKKYKGKINVN